MLINLNLDDASLMNLMIVQLRGLLHGGGRPVVDESRVPVLFFLFTFITFYVVS